MIQINAIQKCPRCGKESRLENIPEGAEAVSVFCVPECVESVTLGEDNEQFWRPRPQAQVDHEVNFHYHRLGHD